MYKLAVFDLDGTLLDEKHEISRENKDSILKLEELGCKIVIATGRSDLLVKEYVKKLGVKTPVISCNGAMIRNPMTKEVWRKRIMSSEKVRDILSICNEEQFTYMAYSDEYIFTIPSKRLEYFQTRNKKLEEDCKVPFRVNESIDCILKEEIYKILIIEEDSNRFELLRDKFVGIEGLEICQSSKGLMDFMVEGTSKRGAIEWLAGEYSIDRSDILAFGDNYNDIEMLKFAGCAVTTENAVEEVKEIADYVSIHHDDNGVSWAIENYVLKK
ncbi:MAG: HAD family hydrolase [Tissierellales bacterium]|jgi:Cof subfamily protein (haloacid dehalogenase superfamily)|nr:HAD family hydrolase [Tissierellales bacterium]